MPLTSDQWPAIEMFAASALLFPFLPLPSPDPFPHLPRLENLQRFPRSWEATEQMRRYAEHEAWLNQLASVAACSDVRDQALRHVEQLHEQMREWQSLADCYDFNLQVKRWWTNNNELARRTELAELRKRIGERRWEAGVLLPGLPVGLHDLPRRLATDE